MRAAASKAVRRVFSLRVVRSKGGALVLLMAPALLMLAGLPALAQEGSHAALSVRAEVEGVSIEGGTDVDRWTFVVEVTNTDAEPLHVDIGYLYPEEGPGVYNDCADLWTVLEPGQSGRITGCFLVDEGLNPAGIDIEGLPDDGGPIPVHVLPFMRDGCGGFADGASCQPAQDIARLIRDAGGGNAAGPPSGGGPAGGAPMQDARVPPGALISRAWYDWDANELVLNLTGPVNPFAVRVDRLEIAGGGCSVSLSLEEYDAMTLDFATLIFELSEDTKRALADMEGPRIRLGEGAFTLLDDGGGGTKSAAEEVALAVAGRPSVSGDSSSARCVITYGYEEPPEGRLAAAGIDAAYAETVRMAVRDGFEAWTEINPELIFEEVDSDPDVAIRWMGFDGEQFGLSCFDCIDGGAYIEAALYDTDCSGDPVALGPETIRDTIAHEFGHNLGLDHHPEETRLVWRGSEGSAHGSLETPGYRIPELLAEPVSGDSPDAVCITYGYEEPPEAWLGAAGIDAGYAETARMAVRDGFEAWAEINPGVLFGETDENPVVTIRWLEPSGDYHGLACVGCVGDGAYIEVALYWIDCRGDPVAYGPGLIRNIIAHEFGHNLGLDHTDDEDHLMAGEDPLPGPFDDLGYAIPERLPEWLAGAEELDARLESAESDLERLKADYDELRVDIIEFQDRHAVAVRGNTVYFSSDRFVDQHRDMIDRLNAIADEHDTRLDRFNALVGEWNCMHDQIL